MFGLRDVMTVKVFIDKPTEGLENRALYGGVVHKDPAWWKERERDSPPHVLMTDKDVAAGRRIQAQFFKNGTPVHRPILLAGGDRPGAAAWLGLHFNELKDCVEIVPTPSNWGIQRPV